MLRIAHRDDTDLVRLNLEDRLDCALQRVLEVMTPSALRPSAWMGSMYKRIGKIRGP